MFGLGWSELMLVGVVALIVVGPKELPGLFRKLGQMTGKARGMAREFSKAMEAAADEAGVRDIDRTIRAAANPKQFGLDKLKDSVDLSDKIKPGGETEKLSQEREDVRKRIEEATAKAATARKEREAKKAAEKEAPSAEAAVVDAAAPKPTAKKKPAPKKASAKAPAAKPTAAKKPTARKTTAKKPAAKPKPEADK